MILVLGMQLERATWPSGRRGRRGRRGLARRSRRSPAFGLAHLVGLQGPALQAGVLQASMPTAVITTILALEFERCRTS